METRSMWQQHKDVVKRRGQSRDERMYVIGMDGHNEELLRIQCGCGEVFMFDPSRSGVNARTTQDGIVAECPKCRRQWNGQTEQYFVGLYLRPNGGFYNADDHTDRGDSFTSEILGYIKANDYAEAWTSLHIQANDKLPLTLRAGRCLTLLAITEDEYRTGIGGERLKQLGQYFGSESFDDIRDNQQFRNILESHFGEAEYTTGSITGHSERGRALPSDAGKPEEAVTAGMGQSTK